MPGGANHPRERPVGSKSSGAVFSATSFSTQGHAMIPWEAAVGQNRRPGPGRSTAAGRRRRVSELPGVTRASGVPRIPGPDRSYAWSSSFGALPPSLIPLRIIKDTPNTTSRARTAAGRPSPRVTATRPHTRGRQRMRPARSGCADPCIFSIQRSCWRLGRRFAGDEPGW